MLTKNAIIGGIATLTLGLGIAPVAQGDTNDREFIWATDQVISGVGRWVGQDGWVGYSGFPAPLRINTAHAVCALLDEGALSANDFIVAALDDRREHAGYLAAWFEQISIEHYCPRHTDKIGTI
jgi:Protein of unknown function (DUF732)